MSLSGNGPFSGSRTTSGFEVQGYTRGRDERLRTQEEVVTPGYFQHRRTPDRQRTRVHGRRRRRQSRNVSVVNETFARRYFAGRDPIGAALELRHRLWRQTHSRSSAWSSDARYNDLKTDSLNMAYRPAAQSDWYLESLEVRTAATRRRSRPPCRRPFARQSRACRSRRVETLDARVSRIDGTGADAHVVDRDLRPRGARALACLGLYGTVSYAVTRRTAELGVRMALGADRGAVRWLIMREALVLVLIGLGAGVPLALLSATALKGILFNVSSLDLASYAAAAVVLMAIATLAAYLPARRASRLDPVAALRAE